MEKNRYIVGDIVKYDGDIGKVIEIGTSDWYDGAYTCKLKFSNGNSFIVGQCDIEPILLTSVILEDNGWKKICGYYCSPNEDGVAIRLNSQTGYVWNAYVANIPLRRNINSVSDLQHLLFGLGINNEMEV